jgi:hypothetical protein
MTQQEHLQRIRQRCVELLEIAEKRTPWKWERASDCATHVVCRNSKNRGYMICDCTDSSPNCDHHQWDSTFIASCAGAAEAGWKATIAAIDWLDAMDWHTSERISEQLIAAWPEELL